MLYVNGKASTYPKDESYHAATAADVKLTETKDKYRKLVSNLRYLAECTRPDLSYVVGRLGAAMDQLIARNWKNIRATMRYLPATRNYGIFFSKSQGHRKAVEASFKTKAIEESSNADWTNDMVDRK